MENGPPGEESGLWRRALRVRRTRYAIGAIDPISPGGSIFLAGREARSGGLIPPLR